MRKKKGSKTITHGCELVCYGEEELLCLEGLICLDICG